MHPNDEGSPTPGRPSLHSTGAADEAPRPRVVGGLDRIEGAVSPFTSPARFPWALSGALLLALGAAAMLWSGDDGDKQIIRAATVAALPEPPAPAAPQAAAWQDGALDDDTPVPLMVQVPAQAAPPAAPAGMAAPVKAAAPAPAPAAHRHAVRAAAARRHGRPAPRARPGSPVKQQRAPVPGRAAPVGLPVALSPSDRDVALVAAVVTRTKAAQAGPSALALKWKQCGAASSVAAARHCRDQLCSAHGDSMGECKGGK